MPDHRKHRGPHPEDNRLFADEQVPNLRAAASDMSWLLSRGYAPPSSLKIVGDRYELAKRQRLAVSRCSASEVARESRTAKGISAGKVIDKEIWIDGFNVLTTVEAALANGVIIQGRDGCFRDMASMHGSNRTVDETVPAIKLVGVVLRELEAGPCRWLLDQPVSNSGRLKTCIRQMAEENGWDWNVELVPDPDPILAKSKQIVVSADSYILDQSFTWFNFARYVIESKLNQTRIVDLS